MKKVYYAVKRKYVYSNKTALVTTVSGCCLNNETPVLYETKLEAERYCHKDSDTVVRLEVTKEYK